MNKGRGDWKGELREGGLTEDLPVYGCVMIYQCEFLFMFQDALQSQVTEIGRETTSALGPQNTKQDQGAIKFLQN